MSQILITAIAAGAALVGIGLGYVLREQFARKRTESAERISKAKLLESDTNAKEIILAAKDKALQYMEEAKRDAGKREQELGGRERHLEKRESMFDEKLSSLDEERKRITLKEQEFERARVALEKARQESIKKLEEVASLSRDEAKQQLLAEVEQDSREEIAKRLRSLEREEGEVVEQKSRNILALAIQRMASPYTQETTTTTVALPSDDVKGRIIGREGRNIKAIEQATGVEIIIDETPGSILISGFSTIRRHVAKLALEHLIKDGRIHPGRIEEAVEDAKRHIAKEIKRAGEDALHALGIAGIDPKLVQILGRLKYRTSYGQNVLEHSMEVAQLAAIIAEELGLDATLIKKGAFFHDIGKAVDHEVQGSHPEIGYNILKKFGFPDEIADHALLHHEDNPKRMEVIVTKAADAISGSRPGARKDTYEHYVQRLGDLEKVALAFPGVAKAYAIQAGREIRVFVTPEQVDDLGTHKVAHEIARKVEEELKYPGEIKVNVIREMRVVEYAR